MKNTFPKHNLLTWFWYWNIDFWIGTYHILEKKLFTHSILIMNMVALCSHYKSYGILSM